MPKNGWVFLALLAGTVAFLGGSSRPDAVQLIALRPLAAVFLIIALYHLNLQKLIRGRLLVALLAGLGAWMVIQLLPLPPGIWQKLPGREPIAAIDSFLGFGELWRPISLNPWRGWNALASLVVPMAALALALAMRANASVLLVLVACLGVFDAFLGLVQIASGTSGPVYFYEHSNRGSPIGIFANENHSAIFSACTLLVLARLMTDQTDLGVFAKPALVRPLCSVAYVLVLVTALVGGSRAGFIAIIGALLASALMAWLSYAANTRAKTSALRPNGARNPARLVVIASIGTVCALPILFIALGSVPAFADIVAQDPLEDLRWGLLGVSRAMVAEFWITGIGFGAYEQAYHMFEPTGMLRESYINQAHNDWLQIVIEGGVIGVAILCALLVWSGRRLWMLRGRGMYGFSKQVFWVLLFAIVAFASAIDYPLRAPAFQLITAWLLLAFSCDSEGDLQVGGDDQS